MSKAPFAPHPVRAVPMPGLTECHGCVGRRRIMVVIGPGQQEAVLAAATAVAAATDADLLLLGIAAVAIRPRCRIGDPLDADSAGEPWPDQRVLDDLTYQRLHRVAAGLPSNLRVCLTLDWGSHTGALLHAIRVEHPDLVVLPEARAGTVRRLLHGHRIRRVLHHAVVPVLVVPVSS